MNKKGYLKTLEAVIAIVAILLFTFGVTPRELVSPSEVPFVVENSLDYITSTLEGDENLRMAVLTTGAEEDIRVLIDDNIPLGYDYDVNVCDETTCLAKEEIPPDISVYSDDVMIAGAVGNEPKIRIVRIWFWPVA